MLYTCVSKHLVVCQSHLRKAGVGEEAVCVMGSVYLL